MVFDAISQFFKALLDPIFSPLLALPSFWAIFLISFVITLAITLVYKYATDQERMKELKARLKKYQEQMKKLRDKPEKMMKVQRQMMGEQMELMKHSFKPTLYTMIPIIIIFSWMHANLAYQNLPPGEEFTITAEAEGLANATLQVIPEEGVTLLANETRPFVEGAAVWTLEAAAGTYKATIDAGGATVEKQFLVTNGPRYLEPEERYPSDPVSRVLISNQPVHPLGSLSLFGWNPGWLGTYVLLSIILSLLLRKALGVV